MNTRIALAAFTVMALAATAVAAPKWNGAGWYVVEDGIDGLYVESGPFASKEACEPNRPPNDEFADFLCEYLDTRPTWDR